MIVTVSIARLAAGGAALALICAPLASASATSSTGSAPTATGYVANVATPTTASASLAVPATNCTSTAQRAQLGVWLSGTSTAGIYLTIDCSLGTPRFTVGATMGGQNQNLGMAVLGDTLTFSVHAGATSTSVNVTDSSGWGAGEAAPTTLATTSTLIGESATNCSVTGAHCAPVPPLAPVHVTHARTSSGSLGASGAGALPALTGGGVTEVSTGPLNASGGSFTLTWLASCQAVAFGRC